MQRIIIKLIEPGNIRLVEPLLNPICWPRHRYPQSKYFLNLREPVSFWHVRP